MTEYGIGILCIFIIFHSIKIFLKVSAQFVRERQLDGILDVLPAIHARLTNKNVVIGRF